MSNGDDPQVLFGKAWLGLKQPRLWLRRVVLVGLVALPLTIAEEILRMSVDPILAALLPTGTLVAIPAILIVGLLLLIRKICNLKF